MMLPITQHSLYADSKLGLWCGSCHVAGDKGLLRTTQGVCDGEPDKGISELQLRFLLQASTFGPGILLCRNALLFSQERYHHLL